MNIVMPMAGRGSRFSNAGYEIPKPLIPIHGKPMVEWAVKSLNLDGKYIFIVQRHHIEQYDADAILKSIIPNCKIVAIDYVTDGQASSILLAEPWIDNSRPLLCVNCDQVVEWNSAEFLKVCNSWVGNRGMLDGVIPTFEVPVPSTKWSYAKLDDDEFVIDVAEKTPISTHATSGIYHWLRGENFVAYAKQMIAQNLRINNEFYACPVYKEAIDDGLKFKIFDSKVHTTGTPEELDIFLQRLGGI